MNNKYTAGFEPLTQGEGFQCLGLVGSVTVTNMENCISDRSSNPGLVCSVYFRKKKSLKIIIDHTEDIIKTKR